MYQSTLQAVDRARQLIRIGEYQQALDHLRDLAYEQMEPAEQAHYHILYAEALMHLGQYEHVHPERAIDLLRDSSDNLGFAVAKYLRGWQLQSLGQQQEAKESLVEAGAAFQRTRNSRGAARALNRLAMILFQAGDTDQAAGVLARAIDLQRQVGDSKTAEAMQGNLALIFFMSGRFADARQAYERAMMHLPALTRRNQCAIQLGQLMAHALQGDPTQSEQLITQMAPSLNGLDRERAQYLEYLGWIRLLEGKPTEAKKTLEECLELARQIAPQSALVAQPLQLLADAHIVLGHLDKAEELAQEALAVAEKITERVVIAACMRVFAQVENNRGHGEKARDWFEKAIELFNLICSRYELAATRYLAATSGVYRNGERAALLYLARQYFVSEHLDHWIVRVDEAVKVEPLIRKQPRSDAQLPTIICRSEAMGQVFALAEQVAQANMTVLLTGETGTGKDLLASYIHYHSGRPGRFVAVNCAAIAETLLESELFGHEKGAFTGAAARKPGRFELAQQGTLLLDEVAEMSPVLQAKLLRVLEERQVTRVGGVAPVPIDVRIIAATNRDLSKLITEQRFRDDLFHRLNVIPIHLPPLRDRRDDLPALVEHFLTEEGVQTGRRESETFERLCLVLSTKEWPGNVRELRGKVQQLVLATQGNLNRMVELALCDGSDSAQEQLLAALEVAGGNQSKAAALLGVSEGTVRKRLRKYRLLKS